MVDRDTGLIRFGYRDYDPDVGRFIAPDPVGDTGGDHDPWEYCVDDPVNMVDPMGLKKGEAVDGSAEGEGFWGTFGWLFPFVDEAETAKKMGKPDEATDQRWSEKIKKSMQGGGVDQGAATDELYRLYTHENKDNMYGSAKQTVDELGPNMVKELSKATPRHQ